MQDQTQLTIGLAYHDHSGNFFVDFSNEKGILISLKISEAEALGLSKQLNLKINQ
jgi:hypothetical protein